MPPPAMSRVRHSHQKLGWTVVRTSPTKTMTIRIHSPFGAIGRCPNASPPPSDPIANRASTMPAFGLPSPNALVTPASTAAHAPMSRNPVNVATSTDGRRSTVPNARFERGMRTRPTSGDAMNQMPPTTRNAVAITIASTVLICVATNVVMTGPATQMSSCADASSENSGVSCPDVTIFG